MNDPHYNPGPPIQFAKVPNNIVGHLFLWLLRRWMNSARYSIVTRGRKPKRGYKVGRWQHDLPKAHAKQLGVYVVDRWEKRVRAYKYHRKAVEYMKRQSSNTRRELFH